MRRLVCVFVVGIQRNQIFLGLRPSETTQKPEQSTQPGLLFDGITFLKEEIR